MASLQLLRGVFSIVTIKRTKITYPVGDCPTGTGTRYSLQLLYGLSPYSPGVDAYNSRKNKRIGLHKNRPKRSGILTKLKTPKCPSLVTHCVLGLLVLLFATALKIRPTVRLSQSFRLRSLETVREFLHEVRVQTTKEIARCMSCYHRRQIAPAISYDLYKAIHMSFQVRFIIGACIEYGSTQIGMMLQRQTPEPLVKAEDEDSYA